MTDLYAVLGVRRTASPETIRTSYRKRAKTTHPDAPSGSKDAFEQVKIAYDTLSDSDARAFYDSTGKIRASEPDQGRGQVLALVATVMQMVIAESDKFGADAKAIDMIDGMRIVLKHRLKDIKSKVDQLTAQRAVYADVAERMETVEANSENVMRLIANGAIASIDENLRNVNAQNASHEAALRVVNSHKFRQEMVINPLAMLHQQQSTKPFFFGGFGP